MWVAAQKIWEDDPSLECVLGGMPPKRPSSGSLRHLRFRNFSPSSPRTVGKEAGVLSLRTKKRLSITLGAVSMCGPIGAMLVKESTPTSTTMQSSEGAGGVNAVNTNESSIGSIGRTEGDGVPRPSIPDIRYSKFDTHDYSLRSALEEYYNAYAPPEGGVLTIPLGPESIQLSKKGNEFLIQSTLAPDTTAEQVESLIVEHGMDPSSGYILDVPAGHLLKKYLHARHLPTNSAKMDESLIGTVKASNRLFCHPYHVHRTGEDIVLWEGPKNFRPNADVDRTLNAIAKHCPGACLSLRATGGLQGTKRDDLLAKINRFPDFVLDVNSLADAMCQFGKATYNEDAEELVIEFEQNTYTIHKDRFYAHDGSILDGGVDYLRFMSELRGKWARRPFDLLPLERLVGTQVVDSKQFIPRPAEDMKKESLKPLPDPCPKKTLEDLVKGTPESLPGTYGPVTVQAVKGGNNNDMMFCLGDAMIATYDGNLSGIPLIVAMLEQGKSGNYNRTGLLGAAPPTSIKPPPPSSATLKSTPKTVPKAPVEPETEFQNVTLRPVAA